MKYHVKSLKLADQGKKRILWADGDMPVLAQVRARFKNMGEDVAVKYDLVRQGGGWRIDNIEGKHWTLRQLLADAGISANTEN